MKVNAARSKIATATSLVLLISLFVSIPVPAQAAACVPTSTTVSGETVLTFSTVGTCEWEVPNGVVNARVLVVGGGSSGGSGQGGLWWPQGGGGGAVVDQSSFAITPGDVLSVIVGAGGAAIGQQGLASTSVNNGGQSRFGTITANGGSAPNNTLAPGGTSGNGNLGGQSGGQYISGGGGGAGGGANLTTGGVGVNSNISGTTLMYGSGGSGSNGSTGSASPGGGSPGTAALANRGGGGSQPAASSGLASAGGSGVVIVRYVAIPAGSSAVSFNSNGGAGTKSALIVSNNTATALPDATGFTNQGYEFTGWNTSANGTGTPYAAGASITTSTNTTLFAQWSRTPVPSCAAGVGEGGPGTSTTVAVTKAGNGCVGISYKVNNVTTVATFNYIGSDQSWTVPANVTSATFYLIGAGGGGGRASFGGGGGGYATGTYAVTPGQVLTVIVGQGGGGVAAGAVSGLPGAYTPLTYGGGGRGGSYGGASALWYSSGGGRSAIRLSGASTDLVTAAGGGGGSYSQCGFGGGGTSGSPIPVSVNSGAGATQSAGGAGGNSGNGYPGTAGTAYQGGTSKDDGGGGGGGFYGGGGGGDNYGGGGGSSYIALLTAATTTAGTNCGNAASTTGLVYVVSYDSNDPTSGSVPSNSTVSLAGGTLTLASNTGTLVKTNYTFAGWNSAANGSGTTYAEGATTFTPSGDTTLYAQWNSTITYDGNGQTSAASTVPPATIAKGSSNTTLAAPTTLLRTNFTFDGWNTAANGSGTSYAAGLSTYTSTGSTRLYAQWKALITFNGNTNSGGSAPATVNAITSTITLPSNSGSLTKTGYAFSGWNTAANLSGTTFAAGDTYTITGPTTLYAAWTPSSSGLSPSFNTNTSSPIGVLAGTAYVINNVYTNNANDLVLSQYADKIQIIATVPSGTLAIATTTNLTLPKGYQSALNTADGTISFVGNLADVNTALATLRYTAPATTAVSTTITITAAYAGLNGDYRYNPTTGSSYWRGASAVVWADAYNPTTAASNCGVSFNGMCGYMVVPNDAAESQWVASILGTGWVGITDSAQGVFKFVANAPNGNGTASFTYFANGEGTMSAEQYSAIYYSNGYWADLSTQSMNPLYEFGGKSETSIFSALTRTITIGALVAPNAPTLDSASDSGTSNSDKITNDKTPTINIGGLTVGATVTLTATPASGTAVTCTFVATTTTSSCTFSTMPDGTYSIVATQTLGGTTTAGSTALANVVIDATRPTVTLTSSQIVSGGNRTATQAAPAITNQITVTFSETISGLLISEITKNIESTGWVITQTAFTTAPFSSNVFTVTNANGAGGTPGTLILSILEGVASDVAGNTNTATASNFVINTLIQLTLTNEYDPCCVIGGNNELIAQTTPGGAITLPGKGTLTRAGHTFAGWSLSRTGGNGTVLGATYTPTVPVKLYSSWIPDVYVVTYNANGGNGAPTAASQNYTFGAANLALTTKGTLTRTGYTFAGWNTLTTGLGTNYLENASYKPTASIILYAKWTANTYTLTYNANGGSTNSTAVITAGTPLTLSTTAGTRAGFTLAGWNTAADGSGSSFPGSTSQTYFSDVTLFALWTPAVPGAPTVSAATAGNTTATATVTPVAASGTTVGPPTSFTVQAFDSTGTTAITGKTCTVLATASPLSCMITGLTNGTTYKFKATAVNTTGSATGAASTVTATPAPFVVTYSPNGGTVSPTTANFNLGSPLTLPLPTRVGYTFTGWNNPSSASVGIDGASYSPSATITLTAQWSANTYTISYSGNGSNGGTVPSQGSFSFGNSYSIVAKGTMSKTGYDFGGWTTASNGTGSLYAHASDVIGGSAATYNAASNLTVYAKWTPQVYVITYNANGATGSPSRATDSFTFGGTPISLPDKTGMTYAGYTFVGWSETSSGAAVVNPYSPTQTRTLYAIWEGISYSISYNVNGGTGSVVDATYTTGAAGVTLNNGSSLTRSGYNFAGWKNVGGTTVSGSAYTPTDNVTLYAIWTPKSIAVTYDKGIATTTTAFPSNTTVAFGANLTLSSGIDVSTTISSTNYLFAGWAINGVTYKSGDTYRVSSEAPITVTAQWLRLFDVRYNVNGGLLAANDLVTDGECVTAGLCIDTQVITLNVAPTRSGFTFNGWNNQGGTLVADSDPASAGIQTGLTDSNYIFYASWTANTYTITFAAGAGSNGNAAAITDAHGAIVQLAPSTGYSLAGSIFTGWLIGGVTYPAGAFYTLGTNASPITATAQYANNTFKVFYNTNGATTGATPTPTSAVQGAAISYNDATGFGRTGFTFEGWSDGTSVRAAGYSTTMGSANETVIAQWKIAAPATPTISSVTGTDGGATITVAAAATGGAPSSYLVTASPGGATCTVTAPATTCSISPLTNGTAYTFSVTASNSTGTSVAATSGSVTPAGAPDAPTGLNAVRGNTQATVTFTPVTGSATGGPAISTYTITAYDANNTAVGTPCQASSSATSCVVTGLTNGTPYTFKAIANNGLFTSSASAASSAVIPATVPDAPTSVSAAVTTAGASTVSFTGPLNNGGVALTGFTVTSSPGGFTCTAAANATSCVISGLTNGTAYTFTVIATNEIGNSVASSATTSVIPQTAASAPSAITATAGDGQASVAFSGAVANGSTIASYTVQAYDSNGNAVSGATCTSSTSPCTVTGLTNGSTYTFKVVTNSTVYSAGSTTASTPSTASNAVIPATVPSAPTDVAVTPGIGKVTVSWTAAASNGSPIISYQVQAYDADGNAVTGATCTATAPAITCDVSTNLVAGSNYTFKVTATSAAGTSAASTASTAAAVNAVPSVPLSVTAVAANASVAVTWGAPANINGSAITGYAVTAYDANNNVAGTCTSVAPATTCVVNGLTNGTPYTFKVTATNGIGTSSESLASTAATPSTIPNAPTGVTKAMGDGQATISFLAPINTGGSAVLSYTVTSSPGNFTCTVNAPATSCNVTGLTNGTSYTFTVKATNKNGDSLASTASTAGTPVLSSAPTLSNPGQPTGNPYVGSTLTSNVTFNGSPTPTVTYQWKACTDPQNIGSCTDISGATSATFTPTLSELGLYIVVDATATNRVGSLTETSNPTLVINPEIAFSAPSPVPAATTGTAYVLSLAAAGGVGTFAYSVSNGTLPAGISLDPATGQISGTPTTAGTYTFTVRVTDSNGVFKEVVVTITVTAQVIAPVVPTCDAACVAANAAAAAKVIADREAADKAAAEAIAKAAAEKIAADAAAAAKKISDAAAIVASTKAAADAAAAQAAAQAAVDRAAVAAIAQAAADAQAAKAAIDAAAARAAVDAAAKAAAAAAAALKNSTSTAVAKAAATAAAAKASTDAAAAVKAAASTAQKAAETKAAATNAAKQVDIAINSLNSKTAAAQASAQADAIAAAAKAAANSAAAAAATKATEAKAVATAAQKVASETAARIATEQKQAADAAAVAKIAAEAAAKATAAKIAAEAAATKSAQELATVLAEKAALAEQAAKATDQAARAEIQRKIDEVSAKVEEAQEKVEEATTNAENATEAQETATENSESANEEAQTQAEEAVAVRGESAEKSAAATKASASATVAEKVAAAAKAAAAKVPAKATPTAKPTAKPTAPPSKNSAKATVTGLKPGQKVKVTVNVKGK